MLILGNGSSSGGFNPFSWFYGNYVQSLVDNGQGWWLQWKSPWSGQTQTGLVGGLRFVMTPGGVTYKVPLDWVGRTADNKKGVVFQDPDSVGVGNGNRNPIRIMESASQYPKGCVRIYNGQGQPVGYNSMPGPNADTHIPEEGKGSFPELPIDI
jgi:hypothetical protein